MKLKYLMAIYRTKIAYTNGIRCTIKENPNFGNDVIDALLRFMEDDFGDLCEEDIQANKLAIASGLEDDRVVARYNTCKDPIYIIAEKYSENEVVVTILFTHEY